MSLFLKKNPVILNSFQPQNINFDQLINALINLYITFIYREINSTLCELKTWSMV